jgi:hypothetical protein
VAIVRVGTEHWCALVLPVADLIFSIAGTDEYDELALVGVLRAAVASISEVCKRPVSLQVIRDRHAQVALAVEELVVEGVLEIVDPHAIYARSKLQVQ